MALNRNGAPQGSVSKRTVTAKGDIIAATANAVVDRLAVGTDGSSIVADSSTSTGLRYTAGNPISNPVLNSAFQVWQRGTSIAVAAASTAYTADRWQSYNGGASEALTVARQATNDTTNLPFIQYCTRYQRNSGQTGTTLTQYGQTLESINSIPYAGKTITFSYYARKGADFSASANVLATIVTTGTGTDQNQFTGFTGASNIINSGATLTTTWQRFTFSATVGATATQLGFQVAYTPVGTAGTNDYFEITGVQIDIGSVALPFRTAGTTYQQELAACRRYLPAYYVNEWAGYAYATNATIHSVNFDTPARVAPTGITSSGTFTAYGLNTGYSVTIGFNLSSVNGADVGTSGATIVAGQGSRLGGGGLILFTGCEL